MANFVSKNRVSIAANNIRKFPFHQAHLTTQNFMQFDLALAKELPKSSGKFNLQSFVRCQPMKKPCMGSVQFHTSAYFVPFRTVWEPFSDFITDTPHNQPEGTSIIHNVPLILNNTLVDLFRGSAYSHFSANDGEDFNNCDFVTSKLGYLKGFVLTAFGRHSLKLLNQLGIRPDFRDFNEDENGDIISSTDNSFSVLPLLCAAKVYQDFYFPNQYAHYGIYAVLDGIFQRQITYNISKSDLNSILELLYLVSYSNDYFVDGFDTPVANADQTFDATYLIHDVSSMSVSGEGFGNTAVVSDSSDFNNGTPILYGKSGFSQYMDDSLRAMTNYIYRHGLAGSRALERYLADWGVTLSADKLKRCYKLGEKHFPLQIADVMSTSDTLTSSDGVQTGATLGEYAGKGVAFQGDFNFKVETDEFGYLLVVSTIVPDVAYYQGLDRNVLHKTKLDFLTGDFDGLGTQPTLLKELFVGMRRATDSVSGIFAFMPRYAEYKSARDCVSGDFVCATKNVGLMGWSTVREFEDSVESAELDEFDMVHSLDFVLANDFDQYNRIFMDSNDDSDKFVVIHRSNFELFMPAVSLYDWYDFDDGKQSITLDVNGVKSN